MLRKYGSLAVLDAFQVPATAAPRRLRKLAHRVTFDYEPRPGFLYVRSRAISSRANDNHDEFPAEEIVKAYRSFLGKPVFVNHHNANHRRARGVIVAVALHRDRNPDGTPDTWAEVLQEIDAKRFPRLCKAIVNGRVNRTSMGVDVEESECSACGNKATDPAQYCRHLPALKGRKIRKRNPKTGKLQEEIIREVCRGLSFFENSLLVEDPADPTAYVLGTPDTRGLQMTAAASAPPEEPDFRSMRGNHCTDCGRLVRWSNHPTRGGWRHLSSAADYNADHPANPSNPADKSSPYPAVFSGTHCAVCHDPVQISLDHLHSNGGWSHYDSMRRDHPATPADPQAVYDSIPSQRAAYQQARGQVEDTLAAQGLPRRMPEGMPPDPFKTEALVRYKKAEDHPWFQANRVSSDNIVAAYHDSTNDEVNLGHRWYEDAHHIAKAIAGGDISRGAGLLAAYSPRTPWPVNMMNASKAHRQNKAFGGPGEGAMGLHRDLAAPIIAGIHHSAAFKKSAPKIGDFAHLVEHGGDSEDERKAGKTRVVIDRHALSAAIGRRVNTQDVGEAPLGNRMMYDHVADAFRHAAERLTKEQGRYIAPHQVQATVWLRQLRVNEAEDNKGTTWQGGGRGRVVRNKNAWQRWHEQAHQHHPEIHPSNQHIHADPSGVIEPVQHKHASRQRVAYGETKMPPQINTLRQEECPVCGEAQVWTGQRCPVCGYVSPPDLFRDPDTSKAMQVREELDQEGDVDIPPEGQGSWPAADEQLYHPDQIAPNGVPSAGPGVPGTDEGTQLEQADDDELPELVCPACGTTFTADEAEEGMPCPQCGQAPLEKDVEPGVEDPDALDDMAVEPGAELEDDEQAEAEAAALEGEGPDAEEPDEDDETDEELPPPRLKTRR